MMVLLRFAKMYSSTPWRYARALSRGMFNPCCAVSRGGQDEGEKKDVRGEDCPAARHGSGSDVPTKVAEVVCRQYSIILTLQETGNPFSWD